MTIKFKKVKFNNDNQRKAFFAKLKNQGFNKVGISRFLPAPPKKFIKDLKPAELKKQALRIDKDTLGIYIKNGKIVKVKQKSIVLITNKGIFEKRAK